MRRLSCAFRNTFGIIALMFAAGCADRVANPSDNPPVSYSSLTVGPALGEISVGGYHSCGLKTDGTIICWGRNFNGQASPPPGLIAVKLSAGHNHTCALKADETVVCWGDNSQGQRNVPAGLLASQVGAGAAHTCAVKTDSSVVCWGVTSAVDNKGQISVPAGLTGVAEVASGLDHTCALKTDKTVICWGDNGSGQRNVPAGTAADYLSGRWLHICAVKPGGTPSCWGHGALAALPAGIVASQISPGNAHNCALKIDATVTCWGYGGQPLPEAWAQFGQTTVPAGLSSVAQVSSGGFHTCALRTDGTVVCWGLNENGQSSVPSGLNLIARGKGLTSSCGHQLTGVAFDGTYYYVAEGQFSLHNCISRFTADSQFIDQRVIAIDMRGLHYVPALGQLTTRHYNGGIVGVEYATGAVTVLANYRTGPDQVAPAVDPAGSSYWIINNGAAEEHRLTDNVLLKSFAITTDNPSVIGVSNRWVYTVEGMTVRVYSKGTGYQVAVRALASPLGCQGWGFGVSPTGERLLEVKDCGTATAQLTGMGERGLTSSCGQQLTGVAFDGTYYYVAEGQFSLYNCISRFTADSQFLDQRVIPFDMRGLHYVPATGQLTTRHYNGGIVGVDYPTGAVTVLANYRTGPDQFAPAVDPTGSSYWIINNGAAEEHRLTDNTLLKSFAVTTDNPVVIGVSDLWVFTHDAATIRAYEKLSGTEVAGIPATIALGCQGWGFGTSAAGDRLLYVRSCDQAAAEFIAPPLVRNTPTGADIAVSPYESGSGSPTPVTLTFSAVTGSGSTTVTMGEIGQSGAPAPPAGFRLGTPPTYYDLQTSASFSGTVEVCIVYSGLSFPDASQLRLLHGDGVGGWADVTTLLDETGQRICGVVSSLSPFLVAQAAQLQMIAFTSTPAAAFVGDSYVITATGGGSGNAVTFVSHTPATCSVTGSAVALLAAGTCTVAADQAGNANYFPAPQVTQSMSVVEVNVAPVVTGITLPVSPVSLGSSVAVGAAFTDGNSPDLHTATVFWDDGAMTAGSVSEASGAGAVSGNHVYTGAGVYTVSIAVSDGNLSGSRSSELDVPAYVVVYDPSAGFVTGGGWITSPVGAYPGSPTLTGKASFGFVSRYKKGATTPSGNTEFHFNAASFEFSSVSYQWLVVAGARAQFKGEGTINGAGNYGFILSAVDGQVNGGGGTDRFRIKIWDIATGSIIYDNQIGAAEDATASSALGGGSIVIHP
jgi:hypothetical protein